MELDKAALLIYYWLKERQLVHTCEVFEEEYGKRLGEQEEPTCSLKQILEALSVLKLFMVVPTISNKEVTATGSKAKRPTKSRKKKISPGKEETMDYSTESTDGLPRDDSIKEINNTKKAKKVKMPIVPPGEWACPEMEGTLSALYDRVMFSVVPNINVSESLLSGSCSEMQLNKIDSTTDETNNIEHFTHQKGEDNHSMYTTDSESDSDDDILKSNHILQLTNGLESTKPLVQCKENDKFALEDQHSTTNKFVINTFNNGVNQTGMKVANDMLESQVKKKKKVLMPDTSLESTNNNMQKIVMKKKKKKLEDISTGSVENVVLEECPKVVENKENGSKKKKRKNEISISEEGGNNILPSGQKKKKKKSKVEEDITTNIENSTEKNPKYESEEYKKVKKKKKKKKDPTIGNDAHESVAVHSSTDITHNISCSTPAPIKKKKKKLLKKGEDTVLRTPSVVENNVNIQTKENCTNLQAETSALSDLFDMLKSKKKKKEKNLARGL